MGLGRVAEVIEHLPSKCEALNSNSRTTTKKKKRQTLQVDITQVMIIYDDNHHTS
jgi:hypothetical protein